MLAFFTLGQSKHEYWFFEKEWRYKIIGMPLEGKWNTKDYDQFLDIRKMSSLMSNLMIL